MRLELQIYMKKKIKGPIHLSGNNENQLIKIFKKINKQDWVFVGWRNHYHALLKGCDQKNRDADNKWKKHDTKLV